MALEGRAAETEGLRLLHCVEAKLLLGNRETFLVQACAFFPFSKWVPWRNEPLFFPHRSRRSENS